VYVSSNHEPNWGGLRTFVLNSWLALDGRASEAVLLLVGSIGDRLAAESGLRDRLGPGLITAGTVSDSMRDLILSAADCILLPITAGGGTNLKTVEALLSGKPIIATTTAFRGLERYAALPQVTIANTAEDFRDALARQMQQTQEDWISPTATRLNRSQQLPLSESLSEITWAGIRSKLRRDLAEWLGHVRCAA
jgi:glycosyltransferase involved in cell wall biosynthesis